jgi:hypothetical protein
MSKREIQIGKCIQEQMDKDGRKAVWLAKQLSCDASLIYRIYAKGIVPAERLIDISIALETDFFVNYSQYVQLQIKKKNDKKS